MPPLSAPTVLALDFDDTLAPTYQAIVPPWDDFMATWLVNHGLYRTEEAARADYIYQNPYGCGPTYFAKKFGQDIPWVDAFYQAVTPLILQAAVAGTHADPALADKLSTLQQQGFVLAIITQGHRDYVLPLLHHLKLAHLFPPHLVVDRAHKRFSPNGFLQLKHLTATLKPAGYIMADDSPPNLLTAAECGYHTVHIHPQATPLKEVHQHFPTLHAYLSSLLAR
ncbi:MAG: HAD hydrolase-like protein [Proteobacteria bacterium]|nr:HAD hydrolase-like protein [Pseudomonadota bacterium]